MVHSSSWPTDPSDTPRPAWVWILVPAVVMSLGWGLRGYIGGGPFGAMIPGALVALMLCQYLGYSARAASVVVVFATLGIGFGGEMTYGQTLGLLRDNESLLWGLTGTTLKGAVWGLLGGAVLGLGFVAHQLTRRQLVFALLCLLVGVMLGLHFINQPKLIYFSNPDDRPRDESWAGFLVGAVALLGYLRVFQPTAAAIPARFALYAMVGGGIGFGGGSLLLALQFRVAQEWRWLPYWKFMEFSFGFLLGAAIGLCAYHLRERLRPPAEEVSNPVRGSGTWFSSAVMGGVLLYAIFTIWPWMEGGLLDRLADLPLTDPRHTLARVAPGFLGMGCLLMVLSCRWHTIAWQTSISVTIVAAALDWERDLLPAGGIEVAEIYRHAFVVVVSAFSALCVARWQFSRRADLMTLFLFACCVLMGFGYLMGLSSSTLWWPDPVAVEDAGGRATYLLHHFRSLIIVHLIFTTLFAISLIASVRARRP